MWDTLLSSLDKFCSCIRDCFSKIFYKLENCLSVELVPSLGTRRPQYHVNCSWLIDCLTSWHSGRSGAPDPWAWGTRVSYLFWSLPLLIDLTYFQGSRLPSTKARLKCEPSITQRRQRRCKKAKTLKARSYCARCLIQMFLFLIESGLHFLLDILPSWADSGSCSPSAHVKIFSTVAINAVKESVLSHNKSVLNHKCFKSSG